MLPFSKAPLGPEGDFDHLLAVGGHGGAPLGILGEVGDPETYLRFDPPRAGSHTVTLGEPDHPNHSTDPHMVAGDGGFLLFRENGPLYEAHSRFPGSLRAFALTAVHSSLRLHGSRRMMENRCR